MRGAVGAAGGHSRAFGAASARSTLVGLRDHTWPPYHVPLPDGEQWFVIQGFDDAGGSHKGYASFCLDLDLAGRPQSDSNGHPFYAASPGKVDFVVDSNASAGSANFISVPLRLVSLDFLNHDGNRVAPGIALGGGHL
jgi:hypothetical protein